MIQPPNCKTCPYFHREGRDQGDHGLCRRFPPPWREVEGGQGCGEHPEYPEHLAAFKAERERQALGKAIADRVAAWEAKKKARAERLAYVAETTRSLGADAST